MSIRRLEKISYQEDQLKLGKDVYGIDAFSKEIKIDKSICGDWFDWGGRLLKSNGGVRR
jgi:hypothetical protein